MDITTNQEALLQQDVIAQRNLEALIYHRTVLAQFFLQKATIEDICEAQRYSTGVIIAGLLPNILLQTNNVEAIEKDVLKNSCF